MYKRWKNKLNVDLLVKDLRLVLTENRPPLGNFTAERRATADRWHMAEGHVKSFLLALVGNALGKLGKSDEPSINGPNWLSDIAIKRKAVMAVRHVRNDSLKEGQDVGDYVLSMLGHFHEISVRGGHIDPVTQQLMILDGLLESYMGVRSKLLSRNDTMPLLELYNVLQRAQAEIKGENARNSLDPRRESDMERDSEQDTHEEEEDCSRIDYVTVYFATIYHC